MHDRDIQIKAAIDSGNIEQARALIRGALQDKPSADTFFFASLVALSDAQRREFLKSALDLDPFHEAAFAEQERLHTTTNAVPPATSQIIASVDHVSAPPANQLTPQQCDLCRGEGKVGLSRVCSRCGGSGQIIPGQPAQPAPAATSTFTSQPSNQPSPMAAPPPERPAARGGSATGVVIGFVVVGLVVAFLFNINNSTTQRNTGSTTVRSTSVPTARPIPTPTLTPHQMALAASDASYTCSNSIRPSRDEYFADPVIITYQLEAWDRFLIVETVSTDPIAGVEVYRSDGVRLSQPASARGERREDDESGPDLYYKYEAHDLRAGTSSPTLGAPATVFIDVPANTYFRFQCLSSSSAVNYLEGIYLPRLFDLGFGMEIGEVTKFIKERR